MTKIYIKPEVETVEIHLEGAVLSASVFNGESSGANAIFDTESDFDSFFNN